MSFTRLRRQRPTDGQRLRVGARESEAFAQQPLAGLARFPRRMRRERDILQRRERMSRRQRFGHKDVQCGVADMAVAQRIEQCRLVEQGAARDVDEQDPALQPPNARGVEEAARFRSEG